jgi:rubrerythrin
MLLDPDTSKRWSGYLQQAEAIRAAERESYERLMQIELKHVREMLQLQLSVKDRQVEIRERQIDQQTQYLKELEKKALEAPPLLQDLLVWGGSPGPCWSWEPGWLALTWRADST